MDLLKNKNIAIIGGGPGGLTLARLLQLKGAEVKVYERDLNDQVRIQGGALDLHEESGLAALKKAGLMDEFKANYRPGADLIRVMDHQAVIHYDQHKENRTETFGDKNHRPEIDRGPLRALLLTSLKPHTVVWNSHLLSVEEVNGGWRLHFENGGTVVADMVIGADGANSKIRPFVTSAKPVWAGVTMIEGVVYDAAKTAPHLHQYLKGGKIFAYGKEQTLIVSSKGDGDFGFAVSFKSTENWLKESGIDFKDSKQVLAWFEKTFPDWAEVWSELFRSEKVQFIPRLQYCMPLNLRWNAQANITLIGDAAHWMPPFAGEGVNMAMLDALELSESLTKSTPTDLRRAISVYEKGMFKRFANVGRMTMFNTKWMHEAKALEYMLQMFGKNIFKQLPFLIKMWLETSFRPFI